MLKIKIYLSLWGPAVLMMAAIFIFSSIPSTEMPDYGLMDLLIKKGGHTLGYGLLALAYLRGLKGEDRFIASWQPIVAWILAALYSLTDEFHQSFVPGRNPAVTDVIIDFTGAAFALFLADRYYKQK